MYSKTYEFILTKLKYMWKIVCIFIPCDKIAKHVYGVRTPRTPHTPHSAQSFDSGCCCLSTVVFAIFNSCLKCRWCSCYCYRWVCRPRCHFHFLMHASFLILSLSLCCLGCLFLMRFFLFTSFRSYPVLLSLLVSFSFHSSVFIYALFTDRLRYSTSWLVCHRIIWLP